MFDAVLARAWSFLTVNVMCYVREIFARVFEAGEISMESNEQAGSGPLIKKRAIVPTKTVGLVTVVLFRDAAAGFVEAPT